MAKKITEKQLKELEQIKEWCLTILNFMTSKNSNMPIINQTKDVVVETYNNQNIKGLRYCNKDINEWAKSLSQSDLDELNNLLRNKFGEDLVKDSSKILTKIKQIVKNGKIANEDEYRLLLSRVDEIYDNVNKKSEVETLNKLLADYHK
jgi:hypothetical protein